MKADLSQDINGGFAFSRCLNGTFPWRKYSIKALLIFSFGLMYQFLQGNVPLRHLLNSKHQFMYWREVNDWALRVGQKKCGLMTVVLSTILQVLFKLGNFGEQRARWKDLVRKSIFFSNRRTLLLDNLKIFILAEFLGLFFLSIFTSYFNKVGVAGWNY